MEELPQVGETNTVGVASSVLSHLVEVLAMS
jgi:hypothetical protein